MTKTNFQWSDGIKINLYFLKITGLWSPKTTQLGAYSVGALFCFGFLNVSLVLAEIVKGVLNLNELQIAVKCMGVVVPEALSLYKIYHFLTNKDLLNQIMGLLELENHQLGYSHNRALVAQQFLFWKTLYLALNVVCYSSLIFSGFYPIFDKNANRQLPYLAIYPFNEQRSPIYELLYVHQLFGITYMTCTQINTDMLFSALNIFTAAQFSILADNLRNLQKCGDPRKGLIDCIQCHKRILVFSELTTEFFSKVFFVQIFSSDVTIALSLFRLSVLQPFSSEFTSNLSAISAYIFEIFLYCWSGSEALIQSEMLLEAIFHCGWEDFSMKQQKTLNFFMLRCSKFLRLSAMKVFRISLETFMKTIKASWSCFALLKQINAK